MSAHSKHKLVNINLLPKDAFADSLVGKYLEWALTTGRYIVIVTQAIVVLTFFQRFTLDRELSDLNDSIATSQFAISTFATTEESVRALQSKAEFISKLEDSADLVAALKFLDGLSVGNVDYESMNVNSQVFNVSGTAFSRETFERYVSRVRAYPGVTDVVLSNYTQKEGAPGLDFSIRIDFSAKSEPTSSRTGGSR